MSAAGSSECWSGSEAGISPLQCQEISEAELRTELAATTCVWMGDSAAALRTVLTALELSLQAEAGCLFVVAPSSTVGQLRQHAVHVDEGYMTRKLKDEKIWSDEFRRVFLRFAARSDTDLWPRDHEDAAARGRPREGAVIISGSGGMKRAAVTLTGLPQSEHSWPGHGTRHTAALQVASFLDQAVVLVRSDGGGLHALLRRPAQPVAAFALRSGRAPDARIHDGTRCVEPPAGPEGWKYVTRRRLEDLLRRRPMNEDDVSDLRASIVAGEAAGLTGPDLELARRRLHFEIGRAADPSNPQDPS